MRASWLIFYFLILTCCELPSGIASVTDLWGHPRGWASWFMPLRRGEGVGSCQRVGGRRMSTYEPLIHTFWKILRCWPGSSHPTSPQAPKTYSLSGAPSPHGQVPSSRWPWTGALGLLRLLLAITGFVSSRGTICNHVCLLPKLMLLTLILLSFSVRVALQTLSDFIPIKLSLFVGKEGGS